MMFDLRPPVGVSANTGEPGVLRAPVTVSARTAVVGGDNSNTQTSKRPRDGLNFT